MLEFYPVRERCNSAILRGPSCSRRRRGAEFRPCRFVACAASSSVACHCRAPAARPWRRRSRRTPVCAGRAARRPRCRRRRPTSTAGRRRPTSTSPGFPLTYRLGFGDGCASAARQRAEGRAALCRRRQLPHRLAGRPRASAGRSDAWSAGSDARPRVKPAQSLRIPLRGLDHHVLTWGDPRAPKLFLLHGWMDVGASFQFLVDALARRLARDRAGPARLRPQRVAAAGLLVSRLRRRSRSAARRARARRARRPRRPQPRRQRRDDYAGARPARVRALVSLDGFGIPARGAGRRAEKDRRMARRAVRASRNSRRTPGSLPSPTGCRRTIRGLPRDKAMFLATHWAALAARRHRAPRVGSATQASVSDHVSAGGSVRDLAHHRRAACCGSRRPNRRFQSGSTSIPRARAEPMISRGSRRRLAHVPNGRLVTIPDAGHMLHHDQPAAVAAAIESFLVR